MDTRLPTVDSERGDHLHDSSGGEQAPEGVGIRAPESGALAAVDCGERGMGVVADESRPVGGVRTKSFEMEQVMQVAAIRLDGGPVCVVPVGELMAMIEDGHEYTVQIKTMRVAEFERMDEFTGW